MSERATLEAIAAKLALEVRFFGQCRGKVHQPLVDGKTPACDCRHCLALAEYDAFVSIVQQPGVSAENARGSIE